MHGVAEMQAQGRAQGQVQGQVPNLRSRGSTWGGSSTSSQTRCTPAHAHGERAAAGGAATAAQSRRPWPRRTRMARRWRGGLRWWHWRAFSSGTGARWRTWGGPTPSSRSVVVHAGSRGVRPGLQVDVHVIPFRPLRGHRSPCYACRPRVSADAFAVGWGCGVTIGHGQRDAHGSIGPCS